MEDQHRRLRTSKLSAHQMAHPSLALIKWLVPESPRTQILRAEPSSNGIAGRCGGHLARETSTLVSHQMASRLSADSASYKGTTTAAGAVCCLWLLFGTSCPLMSTPPRRKGRRGASIACSSSASSARWLTGATVAPPSLPQGHPSSAGSSQRIVLLSWVPLRPRKPAEPCGSSRRRRLVLCCCLGGHPVSRLPNSGQRCGPLQYDGYASTSHSSSELPEEILRKSYVPNHKQILVLIL